MASSWDEQAQKLYEEMMLAAHPLTVEWERLSEPVKEKWRIAAAKSVGEGKVPS